MSNFDDFFAISVVSEITKPKGNFVGEIGQRDNFGVICKKITGLKDANMNGHTVKQVFLEFENVSGDKLQARYTGKVTFEIDKKYTIRGTIKDHKVTKQNENVTTLVKIAIID